MPRDPARALEKVLAAHRRSGHRPLRAYTESGWTHFIFRETADCEGFRSSKWRGAVLTWCRPRRPPPPKPMTRAQQRAAAAEIHRIMDPDDPRGFPKREKSGNSRSFLHSNPSRPQRRRYVTEKSKKSGNSRSFVTSKGRKSGYTVASVIVSDRHPLVRRYGLAGARVISKRLGFKSSPVERTGQSYRFPQVDRSRIRAGSWRTFRLPGRAGHVALLYGRAERVRDNPIPAAWRALPPSSRYDCEPYERDLVGREIPGRGGGRVTGCATPESKFYSRAPHGWTLRKGAQGQVVIGEGERARTMRKSTARHRLRPRPEYVDGYDAGAIEEYIHYRDRALAADELWEPSAPGVEFKHPKGSSRCMPEHPLWASKDDAKEEVARSLEDVSPAVAGPQTALALLREHPKYPEWAQTEQACLEAFERRKSSRAGHGGYSSSRETAERRQLARRTGLDVHGAEYLDQLTPSGRAAYYRRQYKATGAEHYLREARALERDVRARQGQRAKAKRRRRAR